MIRKLIIEGKEMAIPPADKWNIPTHGRTPSDNELRTPYRTLIDPTLFAIMAAIQDPQRITIDVGANIGALARYLALRSQSLYIAIEAGSTNFNCLLKNTEDIPRIRVIHAAVTAEPSVEFIDRGTVCDRIANSQIKSSTPRTTVPGLMLDSLKLESRVGLLKIDAEGYDFHVLLTARELIKDSRPIIFVEAGSGLTRYGSKRSDVFELLRSLKYRNPVDRFGDIVRLNFEKIPSNLIFLPEGTFIPRFGFSYRKFHGVPRYFANKTSSQLELINS